MKKYTFIFKVLIVMDYMLNVLTGGGFDTCFSTRSYINSQRAHNKEWWTKVRNLVDKVMFEEDHCLKSYAWEMNHKRKWVKVNTL
jgi:hypothetical protein